MQVAARTLGDLVRKLGERVLPEIIPILEAGLGSPEPDQRQGVCIGLSEIMASTSKDMVLCFADNLVPTVRCVGNRSWLILDDCFPVISYTSIVC